MRQILKPVRFYLVFFLFPVLAVVAMVEIFQRYFTGMVVQWAADQFDDRLFFGMILLIVSCLICNVWQACQFSLINRKLEPAICEIRRQLLQRVLYTRLQKIEHLEKGEILTKVMQNLKKIQTYYEEDIPGQIKAILQGGLALILCVCISPLLTLAVFGSIPVLVLINVFSSNFMKKTISQRNQLENTQNNFAENVLENLQIIKVFSIEKQMKKKYKEHLRLFQTQEMHLADIRTMLVALDGFNLILPYLVLFGFGAWLSFRGHIQVGQLISFAYLSNAVTQLLGSFQGFAYARQEYKNACYLVNEILDFSMETLQIQQENLDGIVALDHVNFGFHEERKVISDVSLEISKGRKIAFTGASGSGKSTLIKLIAGLYLVRDGRIHIGFDRISYLDQEQFLLPVSVAENIRGGQEGLLQEDIQNAARWAGIAEHIAELPEGYAVSSENWSGGEKQRLCIARMYAQRAELLLMDEPTSALDQEAEKYFWDNLRVWKGSQTMVIVTHSFHSMDLFDQIYHMKDGKIIESGTHEQLCSLRGDYWKMWKIYS